MSTDDPGAADGPNGAAPPVDGTGRRYRQRHRKRQRPVIEVPSWRWWHVLLALGVALVAGGITILLVQSSSQFP